METWKSGCSFIVHLKVQFAILIPYTFSQIQLIAPPGLLAVCSVFEVKKKKNLLFLAYTVLAL